MALAARASTIALLAAAVLGVGACGSDEGDSNAAPEPAATMPATTTAEPDATVTVPPPDTTVTTTTPAAAGGASTPAISKDRSTKPTIPKPQGAPPTELVIKDIVTGKGTAAKAGDTVSVQYVGVSYSTGEQFDASWDRNEPFEFQLGAGAVIAGWDQGVVGMRKGGRRMLVIPPDMAYGAEGRPGIAPNETLVFVIDLLKITPG